MATLQGISAGLSMGSTQLSALDFRNATDTVSLSISHALSNGVGANQVDLQFADQRTLATAAHEDLDLAGVLTDAFGNAITFATIKIMCIQNLGGFDLSVGGAAATQFDSWLGDPTDVVVVPNGGTLFLSAPGSGFAVGAGASDLLRVTNAAGGDTTYNIFLLGTTA